MLSEAARALLQERRFAVLATINNDGTPQQSVMWYLLEGDTIIMNTKVGRLKERNMRRDPRISVCFEEGQTYIAVKGQVEMDDNEKTAQHDIYRLAARYSGEEQASQMVEHGFSKEKRVTLRLKCDHVFERLS